MAPAAAGAAGAEAAAAVAPGFLFWVSCCRAA